MKILQAFKFQLKISAGTARVMSRFAGSCRYVFNKALAHQKMRFEQGERKLTYAALCTQLTTWKKDPETLWLKDSHSQILQQSLKDLERAYTNFFSKRADFPKFKRRGLHDTFRYPQGVQLDQENSRIFLPKIGWVRYRNSRKVSGEIGFVTVSRSGNKWYVSIQTEREIAAPRHFAVSSVGIDLGIAKFAKLSDGTEFKSVNSFSTNQIKLARLQQKLRQKTRFSQNWKRVQMKISCLHQRIANIRRDYLHQTTTMISKNHAMIFIEDLQIKNMSKSAAGTIVLPGKNVKAKSGLNKAILDQGWYEFRRQLEYKQAWLGGEVIAVPAHYTSQTCPECGHIDAKNRERQDTFACVQCGYSNNADLVGAINILRAGHARLACGEKVQSGLSMKQEPTEVTHALCV